MSRFARFLSSVTLSSLTANCVDHCAALRFRSVDQMNDPGSPPRPKKARCGDCPPAPNSSKAKAEEAWREKVEAAGVLVTAKTSADGNTDVSGTGTISTNNSMDRMDTDINIFWKQVDPKRYAGEKEANQAVSVESHMAQTSVNVAGVGTVDFEGTTHNVDDGYASLKFKNLQLDASLKSFFKIQKNEEFAGKLEVRVPLLHHFADEQHTLVFRKLAGIEGAVARLASHVSSIAEDDWKDVEGLGEEPDDAAAKRLYFTVPERVAVSQIVNRFTGVSQNDLGVATLIFGPKKWDLTEQLTKYESLADAEKKKRNMDFSANILPGGISDDGYLIAYLFDLDQKAAQSHQQTEEDVLPEQPSPVEPAAGTPMCATAALFGEIDDSDGPGHGILSLPPRAARRLSSLFGGEDSDSTAGTGVDEE